MTRNDGNTIQTQYTGKTLKCPRQLSGAILILCCLFGQTGLSAQCPLGAKDDHLTIQRVMINFGRYTRNADSVAIKGIQPFHDIQDKDLLEAIADLEVAQSCADAVLQNPHGDLMPDRAHKLTGDEQIKYVQDFLSAMQLFQQNLNAYQGLFQIVLSQKTEERNFKPLREKSDAIEDLVSEFHSLF